jgi:hypothetical protein
MKAILKYNLPDEQYDFNNAINGNNLHTILEDLDEYIRGKMKYSVGLTEDQMDTYEDVRSYLHNLLDDYNINLHE